MAESGSPVQTSSTYNPDNECSFPKDDKTLFVTNISFEITEDRLREVFSKIGEVVFVKIPKFKDGRSRGVGFVSYENSTLADNAMSCFNEKDIDGRIVYLKKTNDGTCRVPMGDYPEKRNRRVGRMIQDLPPYRYRSDWYPNDFSNDRRIPRRDDYYEPRRDKYDDDFRYRERTDRGYRNEHRNGYDDYRNHYQMRPYRERPLRDDYRM